MHTHTHIVVIEWVEPLFSSSPSLPFAVHSCKTHSCTSRDTHTHIHTHSYTHTHIHKSQVFEPFFVSLCVSLARDWGSGQTFSVSCACDPIIAGVHHLVPPPPPYRQISPSHIKIIHIGIQKWLFNKSPKTNNNDLLLSHLGETISLKYFKVVTTFLAWKMVV